MTGTKSIIGHARRDGKFYLLFLGGSDVKNSSNHTSDTCIQVNKKLLKLNSKNNDPIRKWAKRHKHFIEEDNTNHKQAHEKCSTSLAIRKMQMKIIMRCYTQLFKWLKFKKIVIPPNIGKDEEKLISDTLLVEM